MLLITVRQGKCNLKAVLVQIVQIAPFVMSFPLDFCTFFINMDVNIELCFLYFY